MALLNRDAADGDLLFRRKAYHALLHEALVQLQKPSQFSHGVIGTSWSSHNPFSSFPVEIVDEDCEMEDGILAGRFADAFRSAWS